MNSGDVKEMPIDRQSVQWVAKLARIRVDQNLLDELSDELSAILTFVEQLSEVDTTEVDTTVGTTKDESEIARLRYHLEQPGRPGEQLSPAYRADIVDETGAEEVLRNAPMMVSGFFAVPKVVE